MRNNPTGAMGLRDYLGPELALAPAASRSSTCPAARCSPTTSPRRCSHLVLHLGGLGADARPRRAGPAAVAVRAHGPRGLRPGRASPSAGEFADTPATTSAASSSSAARGPVVKCNVPDRAAGSTGSAAARTSAASAWRARCPGFPDKFMPFMDADRLGLRRPRAARGSPTARCSRTSASAGCAPRTTRAGVAAPGDELLTGYESRW